MTAPSSSVKIYLVLVFLSGVLVGAVGSGLYATRGVNAQRPRPSRKEMLDRYTSEMRGRLHLSDDQTRQLQGILATTDERFRALREKYRPDFEAIQEDQAQRIRGILDDAQRREYEKMREERRKHRQQSRVRQAFSPAAS